MFILIASPVFKLNCSNRLLSSSLQSSDNGGLTTLSSEIVTGFVRTHVSFNFVFLVSRHFPYLLAHLPILWNSAFKIKGVEGIRGVGSVSRLIQVLTLIQRSGILAPIQLLQSGHILDQIGPCLFCQCKFSI